MRRRSESTDDEKVRALRKWKLTEKSRYFIAMTMSRPRARSRAWAGALVSPYLAYTIADWVSRTHSWLLRGGKSSISRPFRRFFFNFFTQKKKKKRCHGDLYCLDNHGGQERSSYDESLRRKLPWKFRERTLPSQFLRLAAVFLKSKPISHSIETRRREENYFRWTLWSDWRSFWRDCVSTQCRTYQLASKSAPTNTGKDSASVCTGWALVKDSPKKSDSLSSWLCKQFLF